MHKHWQRTSSGVAPEVRSWGLRLASGLNLPKSALLHAAAGTKTAALPAERIKVLRSNIHGLHESTEIASAPASPWKPTNREIVVTLVATS